MAESDRRQSDLDLIKKAESDQDATKEGIFRIQQQLAETEKIMSKTREEASRAITEIKSDCVEIKAMLFDQEDREQELF